MGRFSRLPCGFDWFSGYDETRKVVASITNDWRSQQSFELAIRQHGRGKLHGFCAWCAQETDFSFDFSNDLTSSNWRESLRCEKCSLINRWRASLHLFSELFHGSPDSSIYVTEQVTPLFETLSKRYKKAIGSEFVGPTHQSGEIVWWRLRRVRHEDATRLSLSSASVGAVLSFDVLEHIPDYRAALSEFARVLEPGGLLLLTAPFVFDAEHTLIRARRDPGGDLVHLLPPVYHGDPMNGQGVLCFQEFGWDLLTDTKIAGFADARIVTAWAPNFGYLGSFQTFLVAWR